MKAPAWARYAKGLPSYEVSSKGDARFSALFARLRDGRTIEEAYQLDIKGYRAVSDNWRRGKGRPALNNPDRDLWPEYLALWRVWAEENPALIVELKRKTVGRTLTDCFATTPINQARALAEIIQNDPRPIP